MGTSIALAFAAGLVATANPCGIAMLPAYLGWFVSGEGAETPMTRSVASALKIGLVMAAGVVSVLAAAGLAVSLGLRALITVVPWLAIAIGLALIVVGWLVLTGRSIPGLGTAQTMGPEDRSLRSVAIFGASYAVASLSCTLPVFLAVAAGGSVQGGIVANILTVLAYGVGMSMLLIVLTVAVAVGRQTLVTRIRRAARWLTTIGGVASIAAGVVLVWFWAVNLAQGNGAGTQSGVFPQLERVSGLLSNWFADASAEIGIGLAVFITLAVIAVWIRSRRADDESPPTGDAGSDAGSQESVEASASSS